MSTSLPICSVTFRGAFDEKPYTSVAAPLVDLIADTSRTPQMYFTRVAESVNLEHCGRLYGSINTFLFNRQKGDDFHYVDSGYQWYWLLKIMIQEMLNDAKATLTAESGFPADKVQSWLNGFDWENREQALDLWLESHKEFEVELRAKLAVVALKDLIKKQVGPNGKVYIIATAFHIEAFKNHFKESVQWREVSPLEFDCKELNDRKACKALKLRDEL